jgi:Flp pilus assembly protein TadG
MRAKRGAEMPIDTSGIEPGKLPSVKNRARERGSAIIEFAVTSIAFLAFLFGIIDTGRAIYVYEFVTYAARAGARWAMVRGSQCSALNPNAWCEPASSATTGATAADIQTYVRTLNLPGIQASALTVNQTSTFVWPATGAGCNSTTINSPGCPVQVQVSYPYQSTIPFFRITTLTLRASSEMVISQ